jgi:DNA-binding transcriptional LysR family regulator
MNLLQLKALMTVAEEKSFSRAAGKLFLTQPAISMQIKGLEEELDTRLFDRVGKRVVLTQAGKILRQRAKNIFKEITASTEEIDDLKGLKTGSLTIGCSDTLSRYYLAEKIGQFLSEFPAVEINLLNKTTPEITDLVLDLNLDLGFVILPIQFPRLKVTRVISYRELAVCSTDHPLAERSSIDLRRLADFPLLLLDSMTKSRVLLEQAFHQQGISVQRRLELGSVEVQKALAQIGLGVAIVPDFSVADDDLHRIDVPQLPDREIGVIFREDRQPPATATAFMQLL